MTDTPSEGAMRAAAKIATMFVTDFVQLSSDDDAERAEARSNLARIIDREMGTGWQPLPTPPKEATDAK